MFRLIIGWGVGVGGGGGFVKSDTCRKKLKGKREVYRRSDSRQELRSCICSGI